MAISLPVVETSLGLPQICDLSERGRSPGRSRGRFGRSAALSVLPGALGLHDAQLFAACSFRTSTGSNGGALGAQHFGAQMGNWCGSGMESGTYAGKAAVRDCSGLGGGCWGLGGGTSTCMLTRSCGDLGDGGGGSCGGSGGGEGGETGATASRLFCLFRYQ